MSEIIKEIQLMLETIESQHALIKTYEKKCGHILKPEQKIIDLSCIGSDIDMEFSSSKLLPNWHIGRLRRLSSLGNGVYLNTLDTLYTKCRIRQNHWHSFKGDECPLPDGLIISYSSMSGTRRWVNNCLSYTQLDWSLIYEFKVIGTADDARYEWQKEKEEGIVYTPL